MKLNKWIGGIAVILFLAVFLMITRISSVLEFISKVRRVLAKPVKAVKKLSKFVRRR